jgi:hypothetical protein
MFIAVDERAPVLLLSQCTILEVCIVAQTITAVALLLQLAGGAGREDVRRWLGGSYDTAGSLYPAGHE